MNIEHPYDWHLQSAIVNICQICFIYICFWTVPKLQTSRYFISQILQIRILSCITTIPFVTPRKANSNSIESSKYFVHSDFLNSQTVFYSGFSSNQEPIEVHTLKVVVISSLSFSRIVLAFVSWHWIFKRPEHSDCTLMMGFILLPHPLYFL